MKPGLCKFTGCDKEVRNFPNSTIRKPYCEDHQIEFALLKTRANILKDKSELEKAKELKHKTPVQKFYSTSAWRNFSHYVLFHYSDENLMVRCSTDPSLIYRINDKRIAVGHYLKCDQHKATSFEFKNVAPQSTQQNTYFSGNMEEMAKWIEKTHGVGTVEWLNIEKNKEFHLDKLTLDNISKHYLKLLNEELKRRNIKNPWNTYK